MAEGGQRLPGLYPQMSGAPPSLGQSPAWLGARGLVTCIASAPQQTPQTPLASCLNGSDRHAGAHEIGNSGGPSRPEPRVETDQCPGF